MLAVTNVFGKNQTTIPKEVRQKLGLDGNFIIEWNINENNEAVLKFKRKYSKKDCDSFFNNLDKISKEMDQGKKVEIEVEEVLRENQV
ncbi:MAG: AbrB/MazE/SpoVT family DNA-binding domain-containing protein [Methanobrevibacter sp.]|jgi:bifunctional DNA-binding transcriptional regulator/antitoxin component of YhaV-PrlF toxin-antitoxin module|nr:AbrB/MazE/SpoVT family DNA-binding domain-containing protein [Candidatus Methanovirga procula]